MKRESKTHEKGICYQPMRECRSQDKEIPWCKFVPKVARRKMETKVKNSPFVYHQIFDFVFQVLPIFHRLVFAGIYSFPSLRAKLHLPYSSLSRSDIAYAIS